MFLIVLLVPGLNNVGATSSQRRTPEALDGGECRSRNYLLNQQIRHLRCKRDQMQMLTRFLSLAYLNTNKAVFTKPDCSHLKGVAWTT